MGDRQPSSQVLSLGLKEEGDLWDKLSSMQRVKKQPPYPKPRQSGGMLIRQVIRAFRGLGMKLPLTSDILIASSAGLDSTALAHALIKYGKRVGAKEQMILLHINHGWRGAESDQDAQFVKELAQKLQVRCEVVKLRGKPQAGESWEAWARNARQRVYLQMSRRYYGAPVITAHHRDDLAETVLWRVFSGGKAMIQAGIHPKVGVEIRPLLACGKDLLQGYLEEEGQAWREDRTNHESRFLRAQIRQELMPRLKKVFPDATQKLIELGIVLRGDES